MTSKDTTELIALVVTLATFIPWWFFVLRRFDLESAPRLKKLGLRLLLKNWVVLAVRTFLLFNLWVILAAFVYATITILALNVIR